MRNTLRVVTRMVLLSTALLSGCASGGAVPRPFPTPATEPRDPVTIPSSVPGAAARVGDAVSATALGLRGTPYRTGGNNPAGFDCSGLVQYVFARHGIRLPRDTRGQFSMGETIDAEALTPGDLVFFSTTAPGPSHVGIALGGDAFVHAPTSDGAVRIERLGARYWTSRFIGARRVSGEGDERVRRK